MKRQVEQQHKWLPESYPGAGKSWGQGFEINWTPDEDGAIVPDVLLALVGRLEFEQRGSAHNFARAIALGHLRAALEVLSEDGREPGTP